MTRAPGLFLLILMTTEAAVLGQQSLADAARKEAERRKALEQQGVKGKVIHRDSGMGTSGGSSRVSAPAASVRENSFGARSSKSEASLQKIRTALRGLDREIQHGEERLALLRARMESERWQLPKVGRITRGSNGTSTRERLRFQILELEAKLKHWRRERYETYESGRKAGYLPGELDGKGLVP